jgi:hypothetical protein
MADRDLRQIVLQESATPRHIPHVAADAAEGEGGVDHIGEQSETTSQLNPLAQDARIQLIKHQCLMASNPQKRLKRLKTEQLPLETIPRDFITVTLQLTITTNSCELTQLSIRATRYDAYPITGKLGGGFEDGIGPEEAAELVRPLLERPDR